MTSVIVVHESFDAVWPWAADHWHALWRRQGPVAFERTADPQARLADLLPSAERPIRRLASLGVPVDAADLDRLDNLQALFADRLTDAARRACEARRITVIAHDSDGYWGQSVAEFALALTLCGLRRIPQTHHQIISDLGPWDYRPPAGEGRPAQRGQQYGDDSRFANGTLAGKRVRIVGLGNIGSRYAKWCGQIGADVAAWDPYAAEPNFHLSGARPVRRIEQLVADAELFAPMVPLTDATRGLVTAELIEALPSGCLVVLVTRAAVCDTDALWRRVLADDLALAADVFDVEPLPPGHPLLGRANVVHTPHNAGRTRQANEAWAEDAISRFPPMDDEATA